MNILLTNDDGYDFIGLKKLKSVLSKYGRVVVVAPFTPMSGMSVAIKYGKEVKVSEIEEDVYAMEGTPADCVSFGLTSLDIAFDLVVSGCNDGFNISFDVLYSGTIGAAIQALTYGVPSIAFSNEYKHYESIDKNAELAFNYIRKKKLYSPKYVLNVNLPYSNELEGIKQTQILFRKECTYYERVYSSMYLAKRDILDKECKNKKTDAFAVHNGYISISKIHLKF